MTSEFDKLIKDLRNVDSVAYAGAQSNEQARYCHQVLMVAIEVLQLQRRQLDELAREAGYEIGDRRF